MSRIIATCPCGSRFRARLELAGQRVECPKCGQKFVVPDTDLTTSSSLVEATIVDEPVDAVLVSEQIPDDGKQFAIINPSEPGKQFRVIDTSQGYGERSLLSQVGKRA